MSGGGGVAESVRRSASAAAVSAKGMARRSAAARSSSARASASGAMRLMRPVRTWPGPTSMKVGDAGGGHRADGADPVDAGGQVVDELGPAALGGGDQARVGVGEERGLRVAEGDPGEDLAHPGRRVGHQRASGRRRETGSSIARFAPRLFAMPRAASTAGRSPLTTTWPGELRFATPKMPWRRGLLDERREARVVEADDRGHAALAARARGLHLLAADPHQADGVGEVEGAGGDEGGVLAHRVAGGERGLRDVHAQLVPALLDGLEVGDRGGEQGRLAVLGPVELLLGTLPREAGDGLAEGGIGGGEHGGGGGGGLGEGAAHADGLAALAGEHEGDLVHQAAG